MKNSLILLILFILITEGYSESFKKMKIDGESLAISFDNTNKIKAVEEAEMIPRGSALITSSGSLKKEGITHIIHAATGSMTKSSEAFKPSIKGIEDSIINSLILAHKFNHKKIAIPFLGGGIFLSSIGLTKEKLAQKIVKTAVSNNKNQLEIIFVTWSEEDTNIFKDALKKYSNSNLARVSKGSITDYSAHKSSVIVNAANMEVIFGGGLSGIIGRATKESSKINSSAKKFIKKFNSN